MSQVTLQGNASGTGIFTVAAPNSNTNRTLTLPDATGTVVTTDATQTLTNKSISGAQINSGTVATAHLGSGTPSSSNFLRGDGSWQVPTPPTDFGAVGTYAVLKAAVNTNIAIGGTIAGSSLRYNDSSTAVGISNVTAGSVEASHAGISSRVNNSTYNGGGTAVSGTWRKVSTGVNYHVATPYDTYYFWCRALWLRIS
jgi:hypothetical protein